MIDLFQQILGVPEDSDAATLLGLDESARNEPVRIEAALRDRLLRVYQFADLRGEDAEMVRDALRHAALQLKQLTVQRGLVALSTDASTNMSPPPRRSIEPVIFNLTSFDRIVMAVLVASGGWNARSRARLVAVASAWGVTVHGLIRVIRGLSEYSQSGGDRLIMPATISRQPWGPGVAAASPPGPATPALLERMTENFAAELKRDDPWPTLKLSMIFGVLTMVACIIGVRIAFRSNPPAIEPGVPATSTSDVFNRPLLRAVDSDTDSAPPKVAFFPENPTFLGNALPPEALTASSQFSTLPSHLEDMVRKITVEDIPSEAVYRNWEITINTVARGWVLGDVSTRNQIDLKIREVLRTAGDRPTVTDRLLGALVPPKAIAEPLDVWRGAWKCGMLAAMSSGTSSAALPPVVVERARGLLHQSCAAAIESSTFETAAGAWLDEAIVQLTNGLETDQKSYDLWELWLAAQRSLSRGERYENAIMRAFHAVVATNTDLARPGPAVNVAARLLHLGLENPTERIKQPFLSFFDDEQITSRDLWVLTSLLALADQARWFPDRLILPEDADQRHRWRVRDELAMLWPGPIQSAGSSKMFSQPPRIDEKVLQQWSAACNSVFAPRVETTPSPANAMEQLFVASRLIEAAESLFAQDPLYADRVLREVAASVDGFDSSNSLPLRQVKVGAPIGVDGEWARAYQDAGRDVEQRLQHLQALRMMAGGDLAPVNASVFVREVYRGSPQEIREGAQEIAARFSNGPNVAQAMLDQFGDAPANENISRVISEFTGQNLAAPRSVSTDGTTSEWMIVARTALLEHLLKLQAINADEIAERTDVLIQSYVMRYSLFRRDVQPLIAPTTLQEAAGRLAEALLDRAETAVVALPVPTTWDGLQRHRTIRLRLAEGPIQEFIAQQLTILDTAAYLLVAEQPQKREGILQLLQQSADARSMASNVFEQAVQIEHAILQMWRLRFIATENETSGEVPQLSQSTSAESSKRPSPLAPAAKLTGTAAVVSGRSITDRLQSLHPSKVVEYFELAEEIADGPGDVSAKSLARHLFALAGSLDPDRYGRSACIALADLETDSRVKRRLRALALLLDTSGGVFAASSDQRSSSLTAFAEANPSAVIALGEAFGYYRRGEGAKVAEALRKSGATELLQQCNQLIPSGSQGFIEENKQARGQKPAISPDHLVRMLRLELALLSGNSRTWSSDLLLTSGTPLIEVDPNRLPESLGVDASRPYYRNGRWQQEP